MFSSISPKKVKRINYNYEKLSPERESPVEDDEKGIKKQKEERYLRLNTIPEKSNKNKKTEERNIKKSFVIPDDGIK